MAIVITKKPVVETPPLAPTPRAEKQVVVSFRNGIPEAIFTENESDPFTLRDLKRLFLAVKFGYKLFNAQRKIRRFTNTKNGSES